MVTLKRWDEQFLLLLKRYPNLVAARAVTALLVIIFVIAVINSGKFWLSAFSPIDTATSPASETLPTIAKPVKVDIAALSRWHLFGQPGALPVDTQPAVTQTDIDAPTTKLNLTLKGVFTSAEKYAASAVIAGPDGKHRSYRIGAVIPGPARLSKVFEDKVLIEHKGRLETLWLYEKRGNKKPSARGRPYSAKSQLKPRKVDRRHDKNASKLLQGYVSVIEQGNPLQLAKVIRIKPEYSNKKIVGVRIFPGSDKTHFERLGLRSDDVITEVNGFAVEDAKNGFDLFHQIKGSSELSISLRRGEREFRYLYRLNQG